jgi:hypothetical protein
VNWQATSNNTLAEMFMMNLYMGWLKCQGNTKQKKTSKWSKAEHEIIKGDIGKTI